MGSRTKVGTNLEEELSASLVEVEVGLLCEDELVRELSL